MTTNTNATLAANIVNALLILRSERGARSTSFAALADTLHDGRVVVDTRTLEATLCDMRSAKVLQYNTTRDRVELF